MNNLFNIEIIIFSTLVILILICLIILPKFIVKSKNDLKNYDKEEEIFTTKITSKTISNNQGIKVFKIFIRNSTNETIIMEVSKYTYRKLNVGDIIHYKKTTFTNKENNLLKEYKYKIVKSR